MATTDTTTDLVAFDAEDVNEDPSTDGSIAKTLAVGATTTVVAAGAVLAYHYVIKPRVHAIVTRIRNRHEDPMVIDGVVVETPETQKV